ncbi:hypothetical protein BJX66DRAFT_351803 [Aspergillus keveii]|uniref:Gylcosyl hydrolase 115 C-terminal domain-containing protein n=1 Tax=Aspergillus keveii TaxID=714993 RepID=A0ABR4GKY5_9EURO
MRVLRAYRESPERSNNSTRYSRLAPIKASGSKAAQDFGRVLGANGTVQVINATGVREAVPVTDKRAAIITGTIGHSLLIDSLIQRNKLDVSEIKGKWESYISQMVKNPLDGLNWALVIAGSDKRGTIYGLYDVSEQLGVSPWYWWADVPPKPKTSVWLGTDTKIQGPPSIKYRGIFINDEAPAITDWAKKTYGFSNDPFRSEFYARVFELLLRLRANYLWPAMWSSEFYKDDELNGPLADEFGIVMGTSHHEPMARAGEEQKSEMEGVWDWGENQENITEFFRGSIVRAKSWETSWTMGMRGSGDAASPTLTADALEEIIEVQQGLLQDDLGDSPSAFPQVWVLYKEVGKYYQAGMKVPDNITLLWTDDNWGNLLRTPLANETDRTGGAGVYYHFDYVGSVRSYKWISTIQLVKTWEQMHLAYEHEARDLWIVNVGDIKPMEVPITHFLDMAYDMSKFTSPQSTGQWLRNWAAKEFGRAHANEIAHLLTEYGKLITRRKYELLSEVPYAYSIANYDEVERVSTEWANLLARAESVHRKLGDAATLNAFFQMILYQILAGKTVVDLYNTVALNGWYAAQHRLSTNTLAAKAHELYELDANITRRYHALNGGKWDRMASQSHIGYTNWQQPAANIMPNVSSVDGDDAAGLVGVAIRGQGGLVSNSSGNILMSMDPYMPPGEVRYFEIFARSNGEFSYRVETNKTYVKVSDRAGTISSLDNQAEVRCLMAVDWRKVPIGVSNVEIVVFYTVSGIEDSHTLVLPLNKTRIKAGSKGHVESNGVISIEAEHYTRAEPKNNISYITIPGYGRTLSGVKLWPATASSQTPDIAPSLRYPFYSFSQTETPKLIVYLGSTLNHDPSRPLRYAFSIHGREPKIVQPVPDTSMGSEPVGWGATVRRDGWISTVDVGGRLDEGEHELTVWLLEPGIIVQKLALDFGGVRASALGPPESFRV